MNEIELEILKANHLEHFKLEKDLSLILPPNHPKRIKLRETSNELISKIQKIEKQNGQNQSNERNSF